jgi:hypothetical protein
MLYGSSSNMDAIYTEIFISGRREVTEDEEGDGSSYWMALRKSEVTGN